MEIQTVLVLSIFVISAAIVAESLLFLRGWDWGFLVFALGMYFPLLAIPIMMHENTW